MEPFQITIDELRKLDAEKYSEYQQHVYHQFKDELHRLWKEGYTHAVVVDNKIVERSTARDMNAGTLAIVEQLYPKKAYYIFSSPDLLLDLEKPESVPAGPEDWMANVIPVKAGILERIFLLQKRFDDRMKFDNITGPYRSESEKRLSLKMTALIHEAVEVQRLTNWKWWKEPKTFDVESAKEELIDIWHFLVSASMDLGMTPEDILAVYEKKNAENHARQNRGY